MYEFFKYYEILVIIVVIKVDKIFCGKWNKYELFIKKKLNFDKKDYFIVFLFVDCIGFDELWDIILFEL